MKKSTNGILDVDTKQMQDMRAQVVEQELSARSWKAYYEKMYYSIEAEKIEPEYAEYKKRLAERLKKEKEEYEKFMATLQENMNSVNAENKLGNLQIAEPDVLGEGKDETPVINM